MKIDKKKLLAEVLNYVVENSNRKEMIFLTTKEVTKHFNISMSDGYKMLQKLAKNNMISKKMPETNDVVKVC